MVETLLVVAVVLLGVLLVLALRMPRGESGLADLRRELVELRASQEATKTEVARAHAQGLAEVAGHLRGAVDQFHGRIAELTLGLTKGQGESAEAVRAGLEQARGTLNAQIASLTTTLQQGLATSQENIGARLADSTRVVGDLRARPTEGED